jgi:hypothetical protein
VIEQVSGDSRDLSFPFSSIPGLPIGRVVIALAWCGSSISPLHGVHKKNL